VTKSYRNLIGADWKDAASGATFTSVSPADHDEVIGEFPASGPVDVDAAVGAAWGAEPGERLGWPDPAGPAEVVDYLQQAQETR